MFTEKLSDEAQKLLGVLSDSVPQGTYLAGGTALAMYLNHRQSFDLDFYSPEKFEVHELVQIFESVIPGFKLTSSSWQTIQGIYGSTEISLFYYGYDLLEDLHSHGKAKVASISDIAAMKIEAIGGRGLKRDFFDVYCVCEEKKWTLAELLDLNQKKYKRSGSNLSHLLKSLVYFDDAEGVSERADVVEERWETVKLFFEEEVERVVRDHDE